MRRNGARATLIGRITGKGQARVCRLAADGPLRTDATLLVLAGVPLKVVSDRLGHENIDVTAKVYTHTTQAADREAADALARVLGA